MTAIALVERKRPFAAFVLPQYRGPLGRNKTREKGKCGAANGLRANPPEQGFTLKPSIFELLKGLSC